MMTLGFEQCALWAAWKDLGLCMPTAREAKPMAKSNVMSNDLSTFLFFLRRNL